MRYFIKLSYRGSKYRGWQTQLKVRTVQETLEQTFAKMTHGHKHIHGCGRTDAEVHASGYIAHVDVDEPFDYDPVFRLNKMLPLDIRIHDMFPVPDDLNAQLHAVARTYTYHLTAVESPFDYEMVTYVEDLAQLQADAVMEAVDVLRGAEDFYSLCKQPETYPKTTCHIYDLQVEGLGSERVAITIKANRFLRSMVRMIVARLLDVGRGKLSVAELARRIETRQYIAGQTIAPARGLYLVDVDYGDRLA